MLTRDEAAKFFGDWHNAIGKVIRVENKTDMKVTGILENTPANTDFPMKLLIYYASIEIKTSSLYGNMHDWISTFGDHETFLILPGNLSESRFDNNLKIFVKKHKPAAYVKDGFELQALSDMHYNAEMAVFRGHSFSKQLLSAISIIGVFLLVIACVNFINLAQPRQ